MVMMGFLDKPQGAEIIGDLGDYLDQIGDLGTPVPPSLRKYWGFGVSQCDYWGFG